MKLYVSMPTALLPHYGAELSAYREALLDQDLRKAWHHLERAHIIGQRYPWPHSYVHWKMLQFGFRIRSVREIFGQLPRLFVGGVKSFVGKVPVGNPGGANVPGLLAFPLPADIEAMFRRAGVA